MKGKTAQILASTAASLGGFSLGTAVAWTSPALVEIDETQCGGGCDVSGVSEEGASWIGAVLALGAMAAGPVTGYLVNKLGRKWTMVLYSLPMALGFSLFVAAGTLDSAELIYIGRILTGFSSGAFALVAPLYIAEIGEDSMRGALGSITQLLITSGIAIVNGLNINGAVSWQVISALSVGPPVMLGVSMLFMPESPAYLVSKGKEDRARKALNWLRGPEGPDPEKELEDLRAAQKQREAIGSVTVKELLTLSEYLKPLGVALVLMFFQQFAGINVVVFYTQEIFADAGSDMDPGLSAFLVTSGQVVGAVVAIATADRFGRRALLLFSELASCLSLIPLGFYFLLRENPSSFRPGLAEDLGWLPLVSLICYVIGYSVGLGGLPWLINAEIHPPESRSASSAAAFSFNWLCAFAVTKFQPELERAFGGASGVYFLFAGVCAAGAVFAAFFLPETKGVAAEDVKDLFRRKKKEKALEAAG